VKRAVTVGVMAAFSLFVMAGPAHADRWEKFPGRGNRADWEKSWNIVLKQAYPLTQQEKWKEAMPLLERAIKIYPGDSFYHFLLAMGTNPGEIDEIINRAADGTLSRPEQMKGVISFEELRALRTANEKLFTSKALMPEFRAIVKTILADLAEMRIHESPGRIAKQVRRTAGALALLGGHSASHGITTADLLQAGKFLMVARVGASEVPNDPHLAYKNVLDKLKVSDEDRKNSWFVSQLHPTKLQN
jgi:hypothetical protein